MDLSEVDVCRFRDAIQSDTLTEAIDTLEALILEYAFGEDKCCQCGRELVVPQHLDFVDTSCFVSSNSQWTIVKIGELY